MHPNMGPKGRTVVGSEFLYTVQLIPHQRSCAQYVYIDV